MKKNLVPVIAAFAIPVVIIAGAVALLVSRNVNNAELPTFPHEIYAENPMALRGNAYSLNAAVEKQLAQSSQGRVLSVAILPDGEKILPIFVPAGKAATIEVGQRLAMSVSVDETSTIVAQRIEKY